MITKISNAKNSGTPIIEIVDDMKIEYISLTTVPNISYSTLANHTSKGETHFFAKGREFYVAPNSD